MLRRTNTLLLCLGALALLTTGSHAQSDTDANEITVDLANIDKESESNLLGLDDGDSFDVGPSSGPFSNKPGWPQSNPGQSDNLSLAPVSAPTTAAPAPATTAPAPATTSPAPTPSMVLAPATKPSSYVATTLAPTKNKPTPAPTGQLDTSSSKCPKGSIVVSVEGKGSYCVSTLKPICSGTSDKGKCPGKQSGLEQGSHCGLVKSGIFGCLPGAAPKRCDVDEDEDDY